MKIDYAMKTLFVADLWFAMSIITSIILEMTVFPSYNGIISICIFAGGIIINLVVWILINNFRRNNRLINGKNK